MGNWRLLIVEDKLISSLVLPMAGRLQCLPWGKLLPLSQKSLRSPVYVSRMSWFLHVVAEECGATGMNGFMPPPSSWLKNVASLV